jgi:ABC-type branched-subunit amino acid transport system substrate-binding protein
MRLFKNAVSRVTLGLTLSLALAACGGGGTGGGGGDIVLGAHVPLSGPLAAGGKQLKAGAEAYFDYINDQGGVNGHRIKYTALNDNYDPQAAVAAARQLVEKDKAVGIVSTLGTSTGLAVMPYLTAKKIPYVAALSGDSRLLGADASQPVYGLAPTGKEMGGSLGQYAVKTLGAKRVAAFYQNDAYGTDGRDGFKVQSAAAGAQYVADAPYEVSTTDYSAQIRQLRSAHPDVVVLYAIPSTAANFLKQAKQQGWTDTKFVAPNPMTDPIMASLAGDALDGLICNFFTAVNGSVSPAVQKQENILKKYHPEVDGGYYSFQGMAGAEIAVEALKKVSGQVTPKKFAAALDQVSLDPVVTAPVSYKPDQHTGVHKFGFAQWKNGKIKVLSTY